MLTKPFVAAKYSTPKTDISIIIAARNEAENIDACLQSIFQQNFPQHLLEVIVVDDHSEDTTTLIVERYNHVQLISLAKENIEGGKKNAITRGILSAKNKLIVTTDADCVAPIDWLKTIAAFYEINHAKLIIAPVNYTMSNALLSFFQSVDFLTMQGITAATQKLNMGAMANGANFIFERALFHEMNGYEGNKHLASGDDYFLLHKVKQRYPKSVFYLKSKAAIVQTQSPKTIAAFLQQRIRWSSKSGKYNDVPLNISLLIVYLFHVMLVCFFIGCLWHQAFFHFCWYLLLGKIFIESILFLSVAPFFKKTHQIWALWLLQPFHTLYILLAGFFGMVGKYNWKGRTLK